MRKPESAKQNKDSLKLLLEINEYINKTKDIKVILKRILKIIKDFYAFVLILLYLWNSEKNKLVIETATEELNRL